VLPPHTAVVGCSGQDIFRKGAHRKARYLFSFPGRLAPLAGGGKLGQLAGLDTPNPVLYIDFPQVREGGHAQQAQETTIRMRITRVGHDFAGIWLAPGSCKSSHTHHFTLLLAPPAIRPAVFLSSTRRAASSCAAPL
jgi:hypothetical protein